MTAYYNEIDPYAAAWLRNLIAGGHIAPGDVDERSILDVRPDDLSGYTQCHFFAGIGVWSYAARRAGWPDERPLWTGSCPCQPFSAAGKGGGFDDERHLWPAWHHLIRERRPAVVFGEQVASKDGYAWLDLVQADMEGVDYALGPHVSPSAGFGAPHERHRIRFAGERQGRVDDTYRDGLARRQCENARKGAQSSRGVPAPGDGSESSRLGDANHQGSRGGMLECADQLPARQGGVGGGLADDDRHGREAGLGIRPVRAEHDPEHGGATGKLADTDGRQRRRVADGEGRQPDGQATGRQQGHGEPERGRAIGYLADATGSGRREERADAGRLAVGDGEERQPAGSGASGGDLRSLPTNGFWRDADWLFCRDGKWRPVEPGTFPLAHGAASRVGRLRAYGNAVDAEATEHFIRAYLEKDVVEIDAERLRLTGVYDDARDAGAFA